MIKKLLRKLPFMRKKLHHRFKGDIFYRLNGLDLILNDSKDSTVLDIASSIGLISYEFARYGAQEIHGFEIDAPSVKFTKKLFSSVPVKNTFIRINLAKKLHDFKKHPALLDHYDIVLFLGIYHHLKKQMKEEDLHDLISFLLEKSRKWFAVRTIDFQEIDALASSHGFEIVFFKSKFKIYKKVKS